MAKIYGLVCVPNGWTYVGCTRGKLSKRMREHRCLLNAGSFNSPKLLADWEMHGEQCFRMQELEEVGDDLFERREAELRWMRQYRAEGKLYNSFSISFSPSPHAVARGVAAAQKTASARVKALHAQPGYTAKVTARLLSPEVRAKKAARLREKWQDPEWREKLLAKRAKVRESNR